MCKGKHWCTISYHIHNPNYKITRTFFCSFYLWQVSLVKKMDGTDWFIIWLVRDGEKKQQKKLNIYSRSWIDILNEIQMKEEKKKVFNYTIDWSTFEIYYNFPSLQYMIGFFFVKMKIINVPSSSIHFVEYSCLERKHNMKICLY